MTATFALRLLAAVCAALGVFPLANVLTAGGAIPWWDHAVREWLVRGIVIVALCTLVAILLGPRLDAAFQGATRLVLSVPSTAFAAAMTSIAFAASVVLAWYCFAGQPFTSDEMAQQWHGRILLSGQLWAEAEPLREFFNTAPVHDRAGRWFSQYPIGGPGLIAAGLVLGGAWVVNPLLLALLTWHLYRFLAIAFGEGTARFTTLLFVASPMVLIMAASQMNHVPALAFTVMALAALAQWDRSDDPHAQMRQAIVIGLALGAVALVRPLDALVVGLVFGAFQAWRARASPPRWRSLTAQLLAGSIPVAILLLANARTTGMPLLFAYEALNGPEHGVGFHTDPTGQMHTPARGLTLVSGYLLRLSLYLFEWPLPGVLFVVAGLAAIRRPTRWDVLLAGIIAGFLVAYGAYWFDGFFSGPRFLFTAVPAFVYFAARAPRAVSDAVPRAAIRRALLLVVPLCVATGWLVPGVSSARARVALYRDQRTKLKTDVDAQVERAELHDALVFINEGWRGRLLARLRVLGASQFRADRIVSSVDACALQSALDAQDGPRGGGLEEVVASARAYGDARLVAGRPADQTIALVPGSTPSPECLSEFQRDTSGTMPYAIFLARQSVGSDGRIGGNVVFARDLGRRNELLRERFGNRAWYRYRPAGGLSDTSRVFLPYVPMGVRGGP